MAELNSEKLKSQLINARLEHPEHEGLSENDIRTYPLQGDEEIQSLEPPKLSSEDLPLVSTLWIYILSIANFGIGSSWAL